MNTFVRAIAAFVFLATPFSAQALDGVWKLTWKGPFGYTYEELEIRSVNGVHLGRLATRNLKELKIDGDQVSFSVDAVVPIGKIQMQFKGTLNGTDLAGKLNIVAPIQIPPANWKSIRYTP